ncbi:hypothetical protein ACRQU7_11855 [Caproiciproducens sp. R1]|uniref:hypothetical protein n=1 Tax=Caproiciproducens sp. R1 TaxID=3435000 RepID=UPI004034DA6C
MILKSAPADGFNQDMLEELYMLAANETELHQLVPDGRNLRAKAKILLSHGLQNIIATLGPNGCFYMNRQKGINFGAANFTSGRYWRR